MQNTNFQKKNKNLLIAGAVGGIVLLAAATGGVYMYSRPNAVVPETAQPETKKKKRADQFDAIPVAERPFVEVRPLDVHNVVVSVNGVKKATESVEYELEYQAGELLQGAFGTLELGSLPATKEILLGTRSAGGATTYHKDVKGGTLVTRFGGTNSYAHKSEWRFIENTAREKVLSSKDAKFQLESADFAKVGLAVITNTPGYPGELTGTPISSIYALSFPETAPTGKATATIRTNEESPTAKIAVYNGTAWTTVEAKVDGKSVTAEVPVASVYVVVK